MHIKPPINLFSFIVLIWATLFVWFNWRPSSLTSQTRPTSAGRCKLQTTSSPTISLPHLKDHKYSKRTTIFAGLTQPGNTQRLNRPSHFVTGCVLQRLGPSKDHSANEGHALRRRQTLIWDTTLVRLMDPWAAASRSSPITRLAASTEGANSLVSHLRS